MSSYSRDLLGGIKVTGFASPFTADPTPWAENDFRLVALEILLLALLKGIRAVGAEVAANSLDDAVRRAIDTLHEARGEIRRLLPDPDIHLARLDKVAAEIDHVRARLAGHL